MDIAEPCNPNTGRKRDQPLRHEPLSARESVSSGDHAADERQVAPTLGDSLLASRSGFRTEPLDAPSIETDDIVESDPSSDERLNSSAVENSFSDFELLEFPVSKAALETYLTQHRADYPSPDTQPHERYAAFLHQLCLRTGTARCEDDSLRGIAQVSIMVHGLALSESYEHEPVIEIFAYAIIIYSWLPVRTKRFQGLSPVDDDYLHVQWSAYYLRLSVDNRYLDSAMRYWEDRTIDERRRSIWRHCSWLTNVHMEDVDEPCFRNDEARQYLETLDKLHIEGLTRFLIQRELDQQTTGLRQKPNDVTFRWMVLMMVSVDPELLRAVIEGQVACKAKIPNTPLANALMKKMDAPDPPPSIYQNAICDHEGISLSPFQWRYVCKLMQLYVSDTTQGDELAAQVD
ncbi:MAG: hypothetical protein Q9219_003511 [cf. Caloplaca sp. 3 TL-2023]